MSTLTANAVRLPEHCEHKLPTSCRLTAKPVCCACQDNRPHASAYQKYIDGIGFVPWGTRQERYCWPCKEFWDVRINVSGMRPADTRLPESPDLSSFLRQWYDWHQGFRSITAEDGREQRQAMVGEPLSDCAHGYLPRSVDELRNGLQPGDRERVERGGQPERPIAPVARPVDDFVVPEDERLFDEEPTDPAPVSPTIRQVAAAEHGHLAELAGDNSFVTSGLAANSQRRPPSPLQPQARLDEADLNRPLRIARQQYQRVTNLRRELQKIRISIDRVVSELQSMDTEIPNPDEAVEQINLLNEYLGRYQEEPLDMPEINQADYVSPIGGMFERAWRWHQQVQSDRAHALSVQDAPPARGEQGRLVPPPQRNASNEMSYEQLLAEWRAGGTQRLELRTQPTETQAEEEEASFLGLDEPGRPPPIEDDDAFKADTRCEVCLQQIANVATFPCGHMVMCSWCADEVIPRHVAARNVPRDPTSKCPQCRRKVRHVYKVHVRVSNDYKKEAAPDEQKESTAEV